MAHAQKFNRSNMGHMLRHYARGPDENVKRNNEHIDPSRTHLNYNLAAELQSLEQNKFIEKRLSQVNHLDYIKRPNIILFCDWVVTLPDNVSIERSDEFFKVAFEFLCERYGAENVISAYVHRDETREHMHFAFIPVVKDEDGKERLCAKQCVNRADLRTFHPALQKYCEEKLNQEVAILNGKTEGGNLTIAELKLKDAVNELAKVRAEKAGLEKAKPIIEEVVGMMNEIGDLYSKLDEALKAKKWFGDDDKAKMKAVSAYLDELKASVTKASNTAETALKHLNGMNETVDSAVESAFQNMREMQKKAERRIKREENKIRRAKGRLANREQELDDCIQEGVSSELQKHDAEIRLKELEKKRLSEEIAEKEDQLDAINAAFWSNHVFMQQALSNRNKFLQKMSEWSERNDSSIVKSDR
ncbi:MAG: plasmid recombination protein [Ruminiclostridium sp.]|nr:plasmid recombination protein [Ruminiclostridium sp.]